MKTNKGITLIALVVTIVVLLILAATSISMLVGENGIITQAQEASIKTENGEVYEALLLKITDNNFNNITSEDYTNALDYLLSEGYIDSNNIVNVKNVTERNMKTGNGSDDKDIYKIEDGNLYYYDKNGEKIELGDLFDTEILEETDSSLFEITEDGTVSLKDYYDYYHIENGTYVSNWPFVVENLVIPSKINGITVTKIDYGFCTYYKHVTTIYIPDTVTYIGGDAFKGCENLTQIRIPNSLTNIFDGVFEDCSSLTSIDIPNSVTSIGSYVFSGCSSLNNLEIPSSVTSIGYWTFYRCTSLTTVNYTGTKAEWNTLLSSISGGNDNLINAKIICTDGEIN